MPDPKQHDRDDQRTPPATGEDDKKRNGADVQPMTDAVENLEKGANQVGTPQDEHEDED